MDVSKFASYLRKLRKQKGITQKQLADRLHITVSAVSKWELGKCMPEITKLEEIAAYFEVPLSDILECEEQKECESAVLTSGFKGHKNRIVLRNSIALAIAMISVIAMSVFINNKLHDLKEMKSGNIVTKYDDDGTVRMKYNYAKDVQDEILRRIGEPIGEVKATIEMDGMNVSNVAVLLVLSDNSSPESVEQDTVSEIVESITGIPKEEVTIVFTNMNEGVG